MEFSKKTEEDLHELVVEASLNSTTALNIGTSLEKIHDVAKHADEQSRDGIQPDANLTVIAAAFNVVYHKMSHDFLRLFFAVQSLRESFISGEGGAIAADLNKESWSPEEIIELAQAIWHAVAATLLDK